MLYAIVGHDVPDSLAERKARRPAHLERLRQLQTEGRLILAGPFPKIDAADLVGGVSGSLIVADFADLEAARAWAAADPFAGCVYASIDVRPFLRTLPE